MTPTAAPQPTLAEAVRPATVTAAYALQLALAGMLLLVIVLTVADAVHYDGLIDRAARATGASRAEADSERSANLFGALVIALPALLLAGWFAGTAWWLRRGSNVARIMALVGIAAPLLLALLACVVGGVGSLLLAAFLLAPSDQAFPEEGVADDFGAFGDEGFYDELWRLDSGGWSAVSDALGLTVTASAVILAGSTAVLLLTGTANGYFRPQRPAPPRPYPPHWPPPVGQWPPPPLGLQPPPPVGRWPPPPPGQGPPPPPAQR